MNPITWYKRIKRAKMDKTLEEQIILKEERERLEAQKALLIQQTVSLALSLIFDSWQRKR